MPDQKTRLFHAKTFVNQYVCESANWKHDFMLFNKVSYASVVKSKGAKSNDNMVKRSGHSILIPCTRQNNTALNSIQSAPMKPFKGTIENHRKYTETVYCQTTKCQIQR